MDSLIPIGGDYLSRREEIDALKNEMLLQDQVDLLHTETLQYGLYTRTLFIPKGVKLVGKIHKKPCVNVVLSGDITIATESGELRVGAGYMITSPAGIQKVGYAHEDTVFLNIFRTDETDISKIEQDLIAESFDALDSAGSMPCLG